MGVVCLPASWRSVSARSQPTTTERARHCIASVRSLCSPPAPRASSSLMHHVLCWSVKVPWPAACPAVLLFLVCFSSLLPLSLFPVPPLQWSRARFLCLVCGEDDKKGLSPRWCGELFWLPRGREEAHTSHNSTHTTHTQNERTYSQSLTLANIIRCSKLRREEHSPTQILCVMCFTISLFPGKPLLPTRLSQVACS